MAGTDYLAPGAFVDRGDPSGYDKTSWTTNGTWVDWDLFSIVPPGAKAIVIKMGIQDDAAGNVIPFAKKETQMPIIHHVCGLKWQT